MNNKPYLNPDILIKIYRALELTQDEVNAALVRLAGFQQAAVMSELLKSLTKQERAEVEALADKTEEEKKAAMEEIVKNHFTDNGFAVRSQEVMKKVIDDHVNYLRACADDAQKVKIANVLIAAKKEASC